jgi:hypothetical protein
MADWVATAGWPSLIYLFYPNGSDDSISSHSNEIISSLFPSCIHWTTAQRLLNSNQRPNEFGNLWKICMQMNRVHHFVTVKSTLVTRFACKTSFRVVENSQISESKVLSIRSLLSPPMKTQGRSLGPTHFLWKGLDCFDYLPLLSFFVCLLLPFNKINAIRGTCWNLFIAKRNYS